MCDAGGMYKGPLSADELFEQVDYVINEFYKGEAIDVKKFKIQLARMGEPALNMEVLKFLRLLPFKYDIPGLLPSVSTIAPRRKEYFFEQLFDLKEALYSGRFQLQFSIHSTSKKHRERIIPFKIWSLEEISSYGERFVGEGDRKITLNFALEGKSVVDPAVISDVFNPEKFLIKITPLNPTYRSAKNDLISGVDTSRLTLPAHDGLIERLNALGFEVILSIGELEENRIGSNCGQYVREHFSSEAKLKEGYTDLELKA